MRQVLGSSGQKVKFNLTWSSEESSVAKPADYQSNTKTEKGGGWLNQIWYSTMYIVPRGGSNSLDWLKTECVFYMNYNSNAMVKAAMLITAMAPQ